MTRRNFASAVRAYKSELFLGALALAVAIFILPLLNAKPLPADVSSLPLYALFSFDRMALGYVFSLVFAVIYGYYAATKIWGEKYLVPILDVLQSIPILGFFPAVIVLFISLVPNQGIGMELAAAFLIFTSMAWNMAYAVYDATKAIPEELSRAAEVFGLRGPAFFARVIVPASIPRLVYNSMVSWSNGWFFLVASEIISLGSESHVLPGLGSFLVRSAANGDYGASALGIVTLGTIVALMNVLIWRPLSKWSLRFKYDTVPAQEPSFWEKVAARIPFKLNVGVWASRILDAVLEFWEYRPSIAEQNRWQGFKEKLRPLQPAVKILLALCCLAAVAYFSIILLSVGKPLPISAGQIAVALAKSFWRLFIAFLLSAAWTIPTGLYMARHGDAEDLLMPVFEIVMAIPGIAFLPAIVLLVLAAFGSGSETIAILLLMIGMQGYLLFNIVSGAKSLPSELNDAAEVYGVHGLQYYWKTLVPATLPSFITGSLTAWGGGWNALVIAEYINFGNKLITVDGIGAVLNKAIYEWGDVRVLTLGVIAMVIPIIILNKYVWKRLYKWALRFKVTV